MRDIEFRGKQRKNGMWVYGDYTKRRDFDEWGATIWEEGGCGQHVIPETVGQYTGLKDKNGGKIFEGDIVRHFERETLLVRWSDNQCAFVAFEEIPLATKESGCYWEIVGNIHDNPELLKGATP